MITVEEKLKLFTRLVYDKIEKQNQSEIDKYNKEYGNIVDEKRKEFEKQAGDIKTKKMKEIDNKKNQIISRAKVEEQNEILLEKKKIFDEVVEDIKNYSKEFAKTEDYSKWLLDNLKETMNDLKGSKSIMIHFTDRDYEKFYKDIFKMHFDKKIELISDNDLIGGFIIDDEDNNIKVDMSLISKIENSKEVIGEKLYSMLQQVVIR